MGLSLFSIYFFYYKYSYACFLLAIRQCIFRVELSFVRCKKCQTVFQSNWINVNMNSHCYYFIFLILPIWWLQSSFLMPLIFIFWLKLIVKYLLATCASTSVLLPICWNFRIDLHKSLIYSECFSIVSYICYVYFLLICGLSFSL